MSSPSHASPSPSRRTRHTPVRFPPILRSAKVEVTFDIDANGILSVHAKDTATGKDQKITITANSGLSEADIQKMVKDAAEHEREDKDRREQIERRNKLDNLCYTLDKTISDNKDKVPAADLATIEALIKEGREAVEKQDDGRVQDVMGRLEKEAHRIAGAMYGAAGAAGGPNGGPPPPDAEGDGHAWRGRSRGREEEGRRRDRRRVRRDAGLTRRRGCRGSTPQSCATPRASSVPRAPGRLKRPRHCASLGA